MVRHRLPKHVKASLNEDAKDRGISSDRERLARKFTNYAPWTVSERISAHRDRPKAKKHKCPCPLVTGGQLLLVAQCSFESLVLLLINMVQAKSFEATCQP